MIERWLNRISRAQKKLDGYAICPYLKKYRSRIITVVDNDIENCAKNYLNFRVPFQLEGLVVEMDHCDFDKLEVRVRKLNKQYKMQDLTVLMMHPDTEEPPLPLEYNYQRPLVIFQNTSTLERARKNLKTTKYYSYYKD